MARMVATGMFAALGLLAVLALGSPSPALAADPGQVSVTSGEVFVTTNGQRNPLKLTDAVHVGDVVETMDGAKLKLTMSDGSVFSLGGNSRLTITNYYVVPGGTRDVQLALGSGLMRAVVTPAARATGTPAPAAGENAPSANTQEPRFEVDTPTAIVTVRGTDFFIEIAGNKTSVGVIEGSVGVVRRPPANATPAALAAANANPLVLNANWLAEIDDSRAAPKVRPWSETEYNALIDRTSVGLGWCQCIADRTAIRASCLATVEDCRSTCNSPTIFSYIPDARQTCTAPPSASARPTTTSR